jgi:hypothetical protein
MMIRWLRRFFYSEDPIVKLVDGLLEPEAQMWREVLENSNIKAVTRSDSLAVSQGGATGTNTGIFVKESDLLRARDVLAPLLESRNEG